MHRDLPLRRHFVRLIFTKRRFDASHACQNPLFEYHWPRKGYEIYRFDRYLSSLGGDRHLPPATHLYLPV
eukprot:COSAG01_NODE_14119_length_1494_cov_0.932616_1_plen_69_part_10